MKTVDNEHLYSCSDFNRTCALKYFGCELVKTRKDQGKTVWFFRRSTLMDNVLQRYWQSSLEVNLVNFVAVQDFMKSSIYASN